MLVMILGEEDFSLLKFSIPLISRIFTLLLTFSLLLIFELVVKELIEQS